MGGFFSQKEKDMPSGEAEALFYQGTELAQQGQYDEALEKYQKVLELLPGNLSTLYNVAAIYILKGEYKTAHGMLTMLIVMHDRDVRFKQLMGITLFQMDRIKEACEMFGKAHKNNRHDPDTLYYWGIALCRAGDFKKAQDRFRDAHRFRRNHADTLFYWGLALVQTGKLKQAHETFEHAHKLAPENMEIIKHWVFTLRDLGREEEAAKLIADTAVDLSSPELPPEYFKIL